MRVREHVTSGLVRLSFRFERFFPQFIKLFLNRRLKEYKKKGIIAGYRVKAQRKGRNHYRLEVDLTLKIGEGGENT
jgi:hypothetical protein